MKFFKGHRAQAQAEPLDIPLIKALLVGDVGSNKSAIANMLQDDAFPIKRTIGMDFIHSRFDLENQSIKLQLWDTAGQERFRTITQAYYRGTKIAIVVANPETTHNIGMWLNDIDEHTETPISKFVLLTNTAESNFDGVDIEAMTKAFNPSDSTGNPVHVLLVDSDSKNDIRVAFTKMLKSHLKAEAKSENASAAGASASLLS